MKMQNGHMQSYALNSATIIFICEHAANENADGEVQNSGKIDFSPSAPNQASYLTYPIKVDK